jgi:hypothetical protein
MPEMLPPFDGFRSGNVIASCTNRGKGSRRASAFARSATADRRSLGGGWLAPASRHP